MFPNKRLTGLCLVLLTSCAAFLSHADEIKPPRLVDWGFVSERLEQASQIPSSVSVKQLLDQSPWAVRSSGLIVIGAAQSHEIESAQRFADIFHGKFGLRLILLAVLDKRPTPAFDGVIIDSKYDVVANFSLKSINRPQQISLLKTVQSGFRKMDEFNLPSRWFSLLRENVSWQPLSDSELPHLAELRSEAAHEDFTRYNENLSHLVSIFTGDQQRTNWLLADVEDASLLEPEDIEKASPFLFESPPRVLLVRTAQALALVHSGRMYVEISPCEQQLAP